MSTCINDPINHNDCQNPNSCFFHLSAIQRGQRNNITGLRNAQGESVYDKEEIQILVRYHFHSIYMDNGARDFEEVISVLTPVVFATMNAHLQSPVTDSEIYKATKKLGGLKALGGDGFPGMFYQRYWNILGTSVCQAVRYFFEVRSMPPELNKLLSSLFQRKMGFGDVWCGWIRACLTTYELEFMVNGDSVGVIKPQRGLRQRDPFSPYLFIIVADVLSCQISKAISLGTLSCIKMERNCPLISHIFFADDSLFFLKASHVKCTTLVSILNSYCTASGQTLNFQKSSAFFSPNTPCLLRGDICSVLRLQQMDSKAKYLGLPSIFGEKKTEMFGFLLDKVLQKMQGWKQKLLSQAGREVLIKSIIQAIPTYAMQCFRLPTTLLNKLIVYVRRFFWGGDSHEQHVHWKNWKKLSEPKHQEGLGFWDFEAFNMALLAKQALRLLTNREAF
ncbi:reverse transcriptase [Tanacetum coccineum]